MLPVVNVRANGGHLFHYAHFFCDCVFPEVLNELYKYKTIYRQENLNQTLGNFKTLYEDILQNESIELPEEAFSKLGVAGTILPDKWQYVNKESFNIFRDYIFNRYKINKNIYIKSYPPVLLIRRGSRIPLISNPLLAAKNKNRSTGAERREINEINSLEMFMREKFQSNLRVVYLEGMSIVEQIKLFNNAKLIVLAHGAAMSNLFFCKENTILIEAGCGFWRFFKAMIGVLKINHIRVNNKCNTIKNAILKVKSEIYVKCIRENCNFLQHRYKGNNKEGYCCRCCKLGRNCHGSWCEKMALHPEIKEKCVRENCNYLQHSSKRNNKAGYCCRCCKLGRPSHGGWCEKVSYKQ